MLQNSGVFRLLVILSLLAGIPNFAVAQQLTQTIRGRVIDKESQEPLIGATVTIYSLSPAIGATTDVDGYFRLEQVPVGRHTLRISFVGYEEQVLPELLLGSGKEMILTIGLTESFRNLKEVVVSAGQQAKGAPLNEMATLSARSISVEETKRYAASINDPARAALNYAGVGGSDDMSNEIVVRGNSPRGVLWRVEGVEVPNPSHFADEGAAGGAISMLSVNMLDNSDFYTGAFPSEYGNALSGVFDIRLRNGNNEKREYAFQAGVLGVDFAAEGPFKKGAKASYLANYRYSTLAMLNAAGIKIAGDATPNFQDFSFKVRVPTSKAGIFSLWGLGGLSNQNLRADRNPDNWKEYYDQFDDVFSSNMGATGLTHMLFLGKDDYLETTLSYSAKTTSINFDSISTEAEAFPIYHQRIAYNTTRLSTLYNRKFNNQHTLRSGIILSHMGYDASSDGQDDDYRFVRLIRQEGTTSMVQGYSQWKYRLSEKITVNTGLHATYFALNSKSSIEPRFGLKWQLVPGRSLSAGVGLHSRHEALSTYFTEQRVQDAVVLPNRNLGFTKAAHYVLAYDHLLRPDLRLKAETYYQHLYNVPVGVNGSSLSTLNASGGFTTDSLINKGTGRNYGLELTLEKFFTNNFYYLMTASLYESKYTATDGIERSTRFNGNYITNFLAGKEFRVGKGGKNLIGTNIKLLWAGGNRYTPIDLEKSREKGDAVYREDQAYAAQADAYFRSDIRVSFRKNNPKASYILSLDLQNVTNRQNMYAQYYDRKAKEIKTNYQMGLVPVLNYRIEF